jgi:hypothetical protein
VVIDGTFRGHVLLLWLCSYLLILLIDFFLDLLSVLCVHTSHSMSTVYVYRKGLHALSRLYFHMGLHIRISKP